MRIDTRACLLAAALLAGCAVQPPAPEIEIPRIPEPVRHTPEPPPPPEKTEAQREAEEIADLLAYYQGLLGMSAEELKREYQNVNQAATRERTEPQRLKLVMLMLLPGAPWSDDARLLTLLEGLGSKGQTAESPLRNFVLLLQRLTVEKTAAVKRIDTQLKEEQKRAEELQQKLDAMLKIEESLRRGRR